MARRSHVVLALCMLACAGEPAPTPDAGPVAGPCMLSADATKLSMKRDESRSLILSAPRGACTVERFRLDREVFQIVNEPAAPFEIAADASLTLTIQHEPTAMLLAGTPIRELVVYTAMTMIEIELRGEAPELDCLNVSETELTFVPPLGAASVVETATVGNACKRSISITEIEIMAGRQNFALEPLQASLPFELAPASTLAISVRFTPSGGSFAGGSLRIKTADPQLPRIDIRLLGRSTRSTRFVVFPRLRDFGDTVYRATMGRSSCGSAPRLVTIANTGMSDVDIDRLEIAADGDAGFEIDSVTVGLGGAVQPDQPFTVPSGQTARVMLRFFPQRAQPEPHEARLLVHTKIQNPARVTLRARAAADVQTSEMFSQPAVSKVDVLWVVHGQRPLAFAETELLRFASAFLTALSAAGADYRMGVTTTDVDGGAPGVLGQCPTGGGQLIRSDEGALDMRQETLRCLLSARSRSGRASSGLEAAVESISRNIGPLIFRPDAKVVVLVVSNTDDVSRLPIDEALDFLRVLRVRTRPDGAVVHALTGTMNGQCNGGTVESSVRYRDAAMRTGGQLFDICAADWGPNVALITAGLSDRNAAWILRGSPDPSMLWVTVDAAVVPRDSTGFEYERGRNAIRFAPSAIPIARASIEAGYTPLCVP